MFYSLKSWLFILILFASNASLCQIFGGNPSSLKWKQINSTDTRIIFSAGLDSTATRITNVIESIKIPTEASIGHKSKKINILLQNRTTISNAFVALGPYKSEFLLTPLQNSFELGSLSWPDQLAIHEYRHVEQFNNFNVGLSHMLYLIFGEQGQALANNAAIPNWFFEGDAVYNETDVSSQGRGRLSYFYNGYRSLWKDGKQYSWMKLRNGSYKDFVPDHYPLGYMLVAYGAEKYGDSFWKNVTQDAAAFKGLLYPFQRAIKKYARINYATFRNNALDFFKKEFELLPNKAGRSQAYVDEEYPAFDNSKIVYIKSGYKQIPEFIIKEGAVEKRIRIRDYSLDNHFSIKNSMIVYASYRPNVRWGYSDYSDIQILNITNGKQQTLTRHTKYFSPDISDDGKRIVVADESINGKCTLDILDATNGKLLYKISNPNELFYTYPKFYGDRIISAVRDTSGKMSLAEIDTHSRNTKYLLPFSYNVIGFPFMCHDTVYFTASYQKNDELFAYTFADKKLWRIDYENDRGLGKYQPAVNDSFIVWTSFTSFGFKLVKVFKKDIKFDEVNLLSMGETTGFGIASIDNKNSNLLRSVTSNSFPIKKYSKSYRLFNFHSIQPNISDPEYTLSLLGENILNTLQSQLSVTYNRAEQFKRIGYSAIYGGWFPFLSAGVNYTIDRRTINSWQRLIYFNELEPYAGISIPLNLSKGRAFTYLNFGTQYVYNQSAFKGLYKDSLGKISYSYSSNFLSFSNQVQKARQEIFPKFAQTLDITYKTALRHYNGNQFLANASIYLPGIFKTHSIVVNGALLAKDSLREINFSSDFPFSRGYESANFYRMYKWGVNYHLPLLYPDAGFGNILYVLRVRVNFFYDATYVNDFSRNRSSFNANFQSAGTEINFDTKWWNQANVSIGFRYSHLFNIDLSGHAGSNRWEIILPVNIFNQ